MVLALGGYRQGLFFSGVDMERLVQSFLQNVYCGRNTFDQTIGPDRSRPLELEYISSAARQSRVQVLAKWMQLCEIDERITQVIERAVADRPDFFPSDGSVHQEGCLHMHIVCPSVLNDTGLEGAL
jgi:hypothetical protein